MSSYATHPGPGDDLSLLRGLVDQLEQLGAEVDAGVDRLVAAGVGWPRIAAAPMSIKEPAAGVEAAWNSERSLGGLQRYQGSTSPMA